jgi:hypothetical protein
MHKILQWVSQKRDKGPTNLHTYIALVKLGHFVSIFSLSYDKDQETEKKNGSLQVELSPKMLVMKCGTYHNPSYSYP